VNFARAFETISAFLDEKGHRYALVGGLALAAYGLPRTTLDLDLLLDAESQDDLVRFLETLGYETLHRSSGYSNHAHPDPLWGRVDGIYVRGETSQQIFAACQRSRGPGGLEVLVPQPEHLAAMKAVAMKNDPERTFQDLADVRFLLQLPGVDRHQIRAYFERHGLKECFDAIDPGP
jgi:hypothetical protein